jgi:hypothetical protein
VDKEARRVRNALNMTKGILRKTVNALESGQLNPKFVWQHPFDTDELLQWGLIIDAPAYEMADLKDLAERYKRFLYQ